ncbi:MAG: hypothetical protein C4333_04690 [Meiothermus sp.]
MDTSSRLSGRQPEIPNLPGDVSLEQDTLFSQLAETVDAAILIYQGGRHIYANSAAERVTGYSREELTTMDPFLLIYPEDRERVRGYHKGLERMAELLHKDYPGGARVILAHSENPQAVETLRGLIRQEGVVVEGVRECGAAVAAHTGPGTSAIFAGPR